MSTTTPGRKVELCRVSDAWVSIYYGEQRDAIRDLTSLRRIEHIGSTAVVGMIARPALDIMVGVQEQADVEFVSGDLIANLGYQASDAGEEDHRRVSRTRDGRQVDVHVVLFGSPRWTERLIFRDILRSDRAIALEYAALKTGLADDSDGDLARYESGKTPFIRRILHRTALGV